MAASLPDLRILLLAMALLASGGAAEAASPRSLPRGAVTDRVLNIDASSWEVDYTSHHLIMRDVSLSQAGLRIQAREAEANGPEMSFDGSRWTFRGDVRIQFEDGNLTAESAEVTFTGNRIARALANGSPVEMEQKVDKLPQPARGRAGNIDYDIPSGRVVLTQGTWFSDGRNEYRGDSLTYSVREKRMLSGGTTPASPTSGGRVHITIRPDEDAPVPAEPPAP
jgi:lipopolysaccharide transport protein LptA